MGAKTTGPHIGKPQNWRNSSTKSRANLVVPASVMGTSRKHRLNSRRYSGLAGKMWVTPRHIECLVFRIFPGETARRRPVGSKRRTIDKSGEIISLLRAKECRVLSCAAPESGDGPTTKVAFLLHVLWD